MSKTKTRAYSVISPDDQDATIVFAHTEDEAERLGSIELFGEDECEVDVARIKWADRYRDTGVPAAKMVRKGWGMECTGCLIRISLDIDTAAEDRAEDGMITADRYQAWTPDHVIGLHRGETYCDARCQQEHEERKAKIARMRERAIRRFSNILERMLPGAEIVDRPNEYGGTQAASYDDETGEWLLQAVSIPFSYPGANHGYAALQYLPRHGMHTDRTLHFVCPNGDVEVFQRYCDEHLLAA